MERQYKLDHRHNSGPILQNMSKGDQFATLRFKSSMLSTSTAENCIFLEDIEVIVLFNIVIISEKAHIIGKRFKKKRKYINNN